MAHPIAVTTDITSAGASLPSSLGLRQRALGTKAPSARASLPVTAQPARSAPSLPPQTPAWSQLMAKRSQVAKTTTTQPVGASVLEAGTGGAAAYSPARPAQAAKPALSPAAATTIASEPAPAEPETLQPTSLLPEQRAVLTAEMRRVLLPVVESFLATTSPQPAAPQSVQFREAPLAASRTATSAVATAAVDAALQAALHALGAAGTGTGAASISSEARAGSTAGSTNAGSQALRSKVLPLHAAAITTTSAAEDAAAGVTASLVPARDQSDVSYNPPRDILLCTCFYHPQWQVFTLLKQRVPAPAPRPVSSAQSTGPQSGFNPLLSMTELNALQPLSTATKKTAASAVKALPVAMATVGTETESVPLASAATAHTSAVAVAQNGASAVASTGTVVPRASMVMAPVSTTMPALPVSAVTSLARAQPAEEALLTAIAGAARHSVAPAATVSLPATANAAEGATVVELVPTVKQRSIPLVSKPQSLTDLKNNLKALRLKRGMSQIALSQRLHTAQSRLSHWESVHDKRFIPDDMVAAVAQALEAPCQYLDRKAFAFTTNDSGQQYYRLHGTEAPPLALVALPHTPQEVKRNLLYLRTQAHLTLRELKQFLPYCSLTLISQWENLSCEELPLGAVVRRLAQVYHCPPELLMLHQQQPAVTAPLELQHVTLLACSPRWAQSAQAQQLMAHSGQLPFANACKLQLLGLGNDHAAQPLRPLLQEQAAVASQAEQGAGAVSGGDGGYGTAQAVTANGCAKEMLLAAPQEQVRQAKLWYSAQSTSQRFYYAVELVTKNSVWSKYAVVQLMGAAPSLQEYVVSGTAYDPSMGRPQQTTGVCLNTEVEEMAALQGKVICLMAGKDQFLIGRLDQRQQGWILHAEDMQGQRCEVLLPRKAIIVGQVVLPPFCGQGRECCG